MKNRVLTQKWIVFICLAVLLFSVVQEICYGQGRGKIYWTEPSKIRRANLDGSNVEDLLTELEWPSDIALDLHNRKMYWVTLRHSKIYRASLDGSDPETIIDREAQIEDPGKQLPSPGAVTLDTKASKIYWGNWSGPWGIWRADNDGSNIENIVIKPVDGNVFGPRVDAEKIQLDVKAGKMYFVDSLNDNIARVNFDGSNYEDLGIDLIHPYGLALDLRNRQMYWTHAESLFGRIRRAALNGDNKEILLTELNRPTDIALDLRSRKMYWIERSRQTHNSKIQCANLDGTNVTTIFTGFENINGTALDTEGFYDVTPDTSKVTTTWANVKTQ